MATEINIFDTSKEDLVKLLMDNFRAKRSWWSGVSSSDIHWLNREQEGANFRFKYVRVESDYDVTTQITTESLGVKLVCPPAARCFFMKIPCQVNMVGFSEPFVYDTLIFCCAKVPGIEPYLPAWFSGNTYIANIIRSSGGHTYTEHNNTIRDSLGFYDIYDSGSRVSDWCFWRMGGSATQFGGVIHRNWTDAQKNTISAKIQQILAGITYGTAHHFNVMDDFPGWETQFSTFYNGFALDRYQTGYFMTYDALPAPLFDYTQTADIIKYINTGDSGGAIDPFAPPGPEYIEIEDMRSDFDVYISDTSLLDIGKGATKYTFTSYNQEYDINRSVLANTKYALLVTSMYSSSYRGDQNPDPGEYVYWTPSYSAAPTRTVNEEDPHRVKSRDNSWCYTHYMKFTDMEGELGHTSGEFSIIWNYWYNAGSMVKVYQVDFRATPNSAWENITGTKTKINHNGKECYRYTGSTGETLTIHYHSISMDDLQHRDTDDGYPSGDDDIDPTTGEDKTFDGGNGVCTYYLTDQAFHDLNIGLQTGDWTDLYSHVDPSNCIITSKEIPFTTTGSSLSTVFLGNKAIAVSSSSVIHPVKKYSCGSTTIGPYNGNFTDITHTRVHCYLPYIGWIQLPPSEVMSRSGKPSVGLHAYTKTLSFAYIVDFIDGFCRCIISVDGTERWVFNGNCGVDYPVISNNHAQALSSSVASGLGSVMSIVGGAASLVATEGASAAVSVPAIIGGVSNLTNAIPQYTYSSSCSPSGLIELHCSNQIMIIVESPNAFYPGNYAHNTGLPCMLNQTLGSLSGYTKCLNIDTSSIAGATNREKELIRAALNSGVYL